jgi:uncharacterized lipoprotein YmbA
VIVVHRLTAIALAVTTVAVTGCFKLARTSPAVERYVLGGIRADPTAESRPAGVPAPTGGVDTTALAIGLRRINLAPYLSTLAIVVRRADNEIITTGFHRWAESPSAGLNRAVSGYVVAAPGIRSVDVAPWHVHTVQDYVVQLHVVRLEGVMTDTERGEAHLMARWEIIRPDDGALLARGVTDHRVPGWMVNDYAGLVSRLDEGLVVLARDLTDCLARIRAVVRTDSLPAQSAALECVAR